jgi:hypothetical protein
VNRPRLVVHGHFYQPSRIDPATGVVPPDPSAAPAHDWNARIAADCYRPNAELGNYGRISWDVGPTLSAWLEDGDPPAYRGFVEGDRGRYGLAQPFHHSILPLATLADRRTEIRWGMRDFEVRFGRRPLGAWLPETAVDLESVRILAEEGIEHTILAPWQLEGHPDPRRPYQVDLGDGRSMVVVIFDRALSTAVSFEPDATTDADRFARERILPRLYDGGDRVDGPDTAPFLVIATDGELYGHHQPFRDHFLARLVDHVDLGFDVVPLAEVARADHPALAPATLVERTSWSCHHGVARWHEACSCVPDGSWKRPLRETLDDLAAAIDATTEAVARRLPGAPDPWAARDAYVDVVIGAERRETFADRWLGADAPSAAKTDLLALMEAQRWRLAMFASCGWYWDVPHRPETQGVIRAAVHAARRIDDLSADAGLERRLASDLAIGPENPSARGLRATG